MRAWTVQEFGPYREKLQLSDQPPPAPDGAMSLIRVKAAGVMFADMLNISGAYQVKAPLPFTPGSEAAGEVIAVGSESKFKVGDRIMSVNLYGAFAEQMIALDTFSFRIPEGMSYAEAAAFTINYQTAYFAHAYRANLKAGETLLVHGGAGGVGTAAIQLGKAMGAKVIATVGSDDKFAICKQCGADHVINYKTQDFVKEVKTLTNGEGANVIFDPVGGDVFDNSTKCVAFEGRLVVIGFAGGRIPQLAVNRVLVKNFAVVGLFWGNYQLLRPQLILETQELLYGLYAQGKIKPVIYREYGMNALPDALQAIEERHAYGKVVLTV
jgi:NADPH2:quinone reductase